MKRVFSGIVAALVLAAAPVSASTFGLVVEGGGTAQVHRLNDGKYLGLWGLDTRDPAQTGGTIGIMDIVDSFVSGKSAITGVYFGDSALNGNRSEFEFMLGTVDVANDSRYYDAFWVEWSGGDLVASNGKGGTATMSAFVTLRGDPMAPPTGGGDVSAVPVPASLSLLLAGVGGVFMVGRRRKKV